MTVKAVVHRYDECLITDISVQADEAAVIVLPSACFNGIFNQIAKYQTQVVVENRILAFRDIKLCLKSDGFIRTDSTIMGYNGIYSLVFTVFFGA